MLKSHNAMKIIILILVVIINLLFGCSPITITTRFDKNANFTKDNTYYVLEWRKPEHQTESNTLPDYFFDIQEEIKKAIIKELSAKEYKLTSKEAADFHIMFLLKEKESEELAYPQYMSEKAYSLIEKRKLYSKESNEFLINVKRGKLHIVFNDAETNHPIWEGCATIEAKSADTIVINIDEVVKKVLDTFPPK